MGHAPPRERRTQRRAELDKRVIGSLQSLPPGAVAKTVSYGLWTGVLLGGVLWGSPWVSLMQALVTLLFVIIVLGVSKRQRFRASPEGAEAWFEREVGKQSRDQDVMEWLPGVERELDYRLGLKQRPEPVREGPPESLRRPQLEPVGGVRLFEPDTGGRGLMQIRPTQPPPKPADAARSVTVGPGRMVILGPGERVLGKRHGIDPELLESARALLRALPGSPGHAWRSEHVHMVAAIMQRARDQNRTGALLALYDAEPELYWSDPGEVCRCGHFGEVHTPFDMPQMSDGTRDERKCLRPCECTGYRPVPIIPLSTHGEPSAAGPSPVQENGAYPPLWLNESRE